MTAIPRVATSGFLASFTATMPMLSTQDANFLSPNSVYRLIRRKSDTKAIKRPKDNQARKSSPA